jgi:hypothetical protein
MKPIVIDREASDVHSVSRPAFGMKSGRRLWARRTCLTLATTLGAAIFAASASPADIPGNISRGATQLWFDGQFAFPLRRNLEMTVLGGSRLGRGLDHFVYERAGIAVSYKVSRFLSLSPSYNYIASQPVAGKDTRETRLDMDGTLNWRLHGFGMSDRNRFERRAMPTYTYLRYMNRFMVQHPIHIKSGSYNLSLADEVFYDAHIGAWSRNRFYAGIGRRVNSHVQVELYYLRQNDHYSLPGDIHAIGFTFKSQTTRK